jgi:hypothetical protein
VAGLRRAATAGLRKAGHRAEAAELSAPEGLRAMMRPVRFLASLATFLPVSPRASQTTGGHYGPIAAFAGAECRRTPAGSANRLAAASATPENGTSSTSPCSAPSACTYARALAAADPSPLLLASTGQRRSGSAEAAAGPSVRRAGGRSGWSAPPSVPLQRGPHGVAVAGTTVGHRRRTSARTYAASELVVRHVTVPASSRAGTPGASAPRR